MSKVLKHYCVYCFDDHYGRMRALRSASDFYCIEGLRFNTDTKVRTKHPDRCQDWQNGRCPRLVEYEKLNGNR